MLYNDGETHRRLQRLVTPVSSRPQSAPRRPRSGRSYSIISTCSVDNGQGLGHCAFLRLPGP
jgi:hypothetical protein